MVQCLVLLFALSVSPYEVSPVEMPQKITGPSHSESGKTSSTAPKQSVGNQSASWVSTEPRPAHKMHLARSSFRGFSVISIKSDVV